MSQYEKTARYCPQDSPPASGHVDNISNTQLMLKYSISGLKNSGANSADILPEFWSENGFTVIVRNFSF